MDFYLDNGYLDVPKLDAYCDKHGVNMVFIIGKRQVGKTYGVLHYMLDKHKQFILMRRTAKEMGMIAKGVNSPFEKLHGYEGKVSLSGSEDSGTMQIVLTDTDSETTIEHDVGLAVALSTVASIRGFNGDPYTDLVYDECIPESHVYKIPHEDEAILNAHVTINGNRELEGRPAIRCWFLANSNKLDCAILKAFNLTDIVEKMSIKGEEFRLLKERGILIFMPASTEITEKRANTALFRAIAGTNDFTKMALGNEFSHNDFSDVERQDLKQYKLICNIEGEEPLCLMRHKSKAQLYVCERYYWGDNVPSYGGQTFWRNKFKKDYPNVRAYYLRGKIRFVNATVKYNFLAYLDLI